MFGLVLVLRTSPDTFSPKVICQLYRTPHPKLFAALLPRPIPDQYAHFGAVLGQVCRLSCVSYVDARKMPKNSPSAEAGSAPADPTQTRPRPARPHHCTIAFVFSPELTNPTKTKQKCLLGAVGILTAPLPHPHM